MAIIARHAFSLNILLLFYGVALHCTAAEPALINVATNDGWVSEHYISLNGEAAFGYREITNDVALAWAACTNGGKTYLCRLQASQLKNAPAWNPEETAIPLTPKEASRIAVERAFAELGPSPYVTALQTEPKENWHVAEINLTRAYLWFKHDHVWYYKVGVKRMANGSSFGGPDAIMLITMDGKAAPYVEKSHEINHILNTPTAVPN
jgi:hypothetical protein